MNSLLCCALVTMFGAQQSDVVHLTATFVQETKRIHVKVMYGPGRGVPKAIVRVYLANPDGSRGAQIGGAHEADEQGNAIFDVPLPAFGDYFIITASTAKGVPSKEEPKIEWIVPYAYELTIRRRPEEMSATTECREIVCCDAVRKCIQTPCVPPCGSPCSHGCWEPCCCNPCVVAPCDPSPPCGCGLGFTGRGPRKVGTAKLAVSVPQDAVVFVNRHRTTTAGTQREYASRNMEPGQVYRYEVRAQVVRDGKTVEKTKMVLMRPGDKKNIAFDFSGNDSNELASLRTR